MKTSNLDIDPVNLSDKAAEYLNKAHRIAFAHISPDLVILKASPNFHELLEDPPDKLEGRQLSDLLWEFFGAEDGLKEVFEGVLSKYTLKGVNRRQFDGSMRYLNFSLTLVDRNHPDQGFLLFIEDNTQIGQLEQSLVQERNELELAQSRLARANAELKRLDGLKSMFLSIAAHDIRAPLTAIRGFAEVLLMTMSSEVAEEQRNYLSIIVSQVDRLDRLITNLLDLDQIEKGTLSVDLIPCDLNQIAQEVVENMVIYAERQGIELLSVIPESKVMAIADSDRMEQILYNLLSNAIKYSSSGDRVEVKSWEEGQNVFIQVNDTGPGIPPDELEHLFERYYRSKKARKSSTKGSGLGLFIVKSLVDAQKGQVEVTSDLGVGTNFIVKLPLANS
jgi:signal transduction histidine kinase